ncbi:MAG: tetratricopeptide repeat protein, partial [Fervidobacterium sp.]
ERELIELLKSVNYDELSPEEKGDIVIAYSELYSWGGMGYNYSEKAYELAEELTKNYPNFWKGYYCLALVLAHRIQKNNLLAFTNLSKLDYNLGMAIKLGEKEWLPHYLAAVRYIEVPIFPDLRKGEEFLNKVLELEPTHIYAYVIYGKLYEKKGLFCEAEKMYKIALEMSIRAEWKIIDEEAKSIAKQRLLEVERACTKK